MDIISQIKVHEQEVFSKKLPSDLGICPICHQTPTFFNFHSYKKRTFLVIVDGFVQKIDSFLGRWKCPICKGSFTYYPDFALPYKRYVKDNIVDLSHQYVVNDEITYEEVVKNNGMGIGYAHSTDKIDERQLVGSTVWRWLGWIGSLSQLISRGFDIIRQKLPSSNIFRDIWLIHPQKYRSDKRKTLLSQSLNLFNIELVFKKVFGRSIFPKFAISYL